MQIFSSNVLYLTRLASFFPCKIVSSLVHAQNRINIIQNLLDFLCFFVWSLNYKPFKDSEPKKSYVTKNFWYWIIIPVCIKTWKYFCKLSNKRDRPHTQSHTVEEQRQRRQEKVYQKNVWKWKEKCSRVIIIRGDFVAVLRQWSIGRGWHPSFSHGWWSSGSTFGW